MSDEFSVHHFCNAIFSPPIMPAIKEQGVHTSKLLQQFLQNSETEYICLRDLLNQLGNRAYGPTLLSCTLPEALPLPIAGVSAIIGIPLMLISAQLFLGVAKPKLPRWIADRSIKRTKFAKIVNQGLHYLEKVERLIRPRWRFFTLPIVKQLLGLLIFVLAFVIALPIPFGNMPPAIAILVLSIGMIEQDGLVIVLGVVGACIILTVTVSAINALFFLGLNFLRNR